MVDFFRLHQSNFGWRGAALAALFAGILQPACGRSGGSASAPNASGSGAGSNGKGGASGAANAAGKGNGAGGSGRDNAGRGGTAGTSGSNAQAGGGGAGKSGAGGAAGSSSGSTSQGGDSPTGGTGGNGGDAGDENAGTAGQPDGCQVTTVTAHGTRARSSGFSGTLEQYGTLYSGACDTDMDCAAPCLEVGGTEEMCAANYCEMSTPNYCLPATIWTQLDAVYTEGTDALLDGAELIVWPDPYRDFLLVDTFGLTVPDDAEILGIKATIRRAGGGPDEVADSGVYLLRGGVMGTVDRSVTTPWSGPDLVNADYGAPTDLWGEAWSPADVNDEGFGVAMSAMYPSDMGNGRAYVDIIYVTVAYRTCP